ncbi:hypothetical protein C2L65_12090 [Paraburkholderia terrae]|uniref:Uncharacterized protein n=2 Tax=Paraburkholderia terrae TaxID=311230 RepID=A0A2I8ELJ5_9BURK|nr:hypothetical protein C2L65_12090 [Paraburkholderia terrae]
MDDHGRLASPDPSLGEMLVYPRIAHLIAAGIGLYLDSAITGLQIAATASLLLAWIAIAYILTAFPWRGRLLSLTMLSVVLLANKLFFKLQIFGEEIVSDFFFAQLAAQAALLCVLAITLRLERRYSSRSIRYVFLIGSILAIESIHLLPALEGLGVLAFFLLSDTLDDLNSAILPSVRVKSLLVRGIVFAACGVAMLAHPTYKVMRSISENNGVLRLTRFDSIESLLVLACVVAVLSASLLISWHRGSVDARRDRLPVKYLGAFGLTVSCLCVAQWIALQFGLGSEYACKKYIYALDTLFLIEIVLLVVERSSIVLDRAREPIKGLPACLDALLVSALVAIAFVSTTPRHATLSLKAIRAVEADVRLVVVKSPRSPGDKPMVAIHLPMMNPLLDYMFSTAVLRTPRDEMVMAILLNRRITSLESASKIVTARNDATYDVPACRGPGTTGNVAVIDTKCYVTEKQLNVTCRSDFDLTSSGAIHPSMLTGFSSPEPNGTWTEGHEASFKCELPKAGHFRPKRVEVVGTAFVAENRQQQIVATIAGTTSTQTVDFSHPGETKVITLPTSDQDQGWLVIQLSMPDALSPAQAGLSADSRVLGLQVKEIRLR